MDEKHQQLIQKNYQSLVGLTKIDLLLPALLEKNVFSQAMIEKHNHKDASARTRSLYLDICHRGPKAFDKLKEALHETGHWDALHLLDPNQGLNMAQKYVSLSTAKKQVKTQANTGEPSTKMPLTSSTLINGNTITDHEVQPIIVTKALEFGQSKNPEITCYSMKSRKRGILFMLNNITFEGNVAEYRKGAETDQNNLKDLFTQIGFHKIIIHEDLKKRDLEDTLNTFVVSKDLEQVDCVFIVIASHGMTRSDTNETYITCSDGGLVSTWSILEKFNSRNCHSLHNIPKIFIFQICRGDSIDYGANPEIIKKESFMNRTQIDGRSDNTPMRTYSDMLIAHSTIPGYTSHRDIYQGSWYIYSICNIFMTHAHNTHLEDLFKLVDDYLKNITLKRQSLQTSSVQNWGFNKYCFLNPGLFG